MVIWRDLEAIMLTEIFQKKTNDFTCMYSLKNKTNKETKAERESQRQQTNQWLPEGKRGGEIKRVTLPLPNKRVTKIKCTARGIQSIR